MKQMRILLCVAACMLLFSGCKAIYGHQLEGDWVVDRYYYDGNDQTAIKNALKYQITFHSDGDFTESTEVFTVVIPVNGTWAIEKKPDGKLGEFQLKLNDDTYGVRTFDIKKISRDTIDIYRDIDSDHNEEYVLEHPPEA